MQNWYFICTYYENNQYNVSEFSIKIYKRLAPKKIHCASKLNIGNGTKKELFARACFIEVQSKIRGLSTIYDTFKLNFIWDILPEVHDISMVAQTCDFALSSVLSHFCYQFIQVVRVFFHPTLVVSLQHCLLTHLFEINFLCKILTIVHFVDLREPIYTERKRNFSLLSLNFA